jgi:hypothetical protein
VATPWTRRREPHICHRAVDPARDSGQARQIKRTSTSRPRGVEFTGFSSPSGNVGCFIEVDYVRCDIGEADWSPPPRPADCEFDYGQGIALERGGRAEFVGAGDTSLGAEDILKLRRVDTRRAAAMRQCGVRHHLPRCRDQPGLLDFTQGVSVVLSAQEATALRSSLRFVQLHFGGLSSSFATGDDVVRGARM